MTKPIVLIIAMESERRHLDTLLPGWEPVESVWPTVRNGNLICITCGVGLTLAAAATEHAISSYEPVAVLNYGCTGAHVRDIYPGDVVIGNRLVHHGRLRFPPNRSIEPMSVGFHIPGEIEPTELLATDRELLELANEVAQEIDLPDWPRELRVENQPDRAPEVRIGTVSSGDIWMQNPELIDAGHERTGSLCEDMEAAAIGLIAAVHQVPFLTIKDISNSEFHEVTVFGTGTALPFEEVGRRAVMLVAEVIQRLQAEDSVYS